MKATPARSDDFLPARRSLNLPREAAVGPPAEEKSLSLWLIWRALRRYWWQIPLVWVVISCVLTAMIWMKVKPSYVSVARIKVELASVLVYDSGNRAPVDFRQYMETQVSNLGSRHIVHAAFVAKPEIATVPMLRGSSDPEDDVCHVLSVGTVQSTNMIQVSMSSENADEGPLIVNAVVDAFLEVARSTYDQTTQDKIKRLTSVEKDQNDKVEMGRKEIESLHRRIGDADLKRIQDRNNTSLDTYRRLSEALTDVEILRIKAQARLDQLRKDKTPPIRPHDDESIKQAVTEEFYADTRAASLQMQREKAQSKLKEAERLARNPSDPARHHADDLVRSLDEKINELWGKLEPGLRRKVTTLPADDSVDRVITDAEADFTALKTQEENLSSKLEKVRLEDKATRGEVLQLVYKQRDLERAETVLDKIQDNLSQLKYESRSPVAQCEWVFKAEKAARPNRDYRILDTLGAVGGSGLLILGMFMFLEYHAARVNDPEELTSRVKLQVIGVVPPLPQIRTAVSSSSGSGSGNLPTTAADLRAQRQLDEFVQSLDHLRVALCARRDAWGRDRHCFVITSACGGEGKTTLAAQLAERCVNAGLMTLLIDADLRNPTLSRMLDAPDSPGLINVLRGEVTPEDVVMVIGDAGGFHLLPAGNPRMDPSRLLASDRLGKLLAQARESFDMVIVDAPPVLPVPDALTIGRWTDGAVIAVRYETSRFPLVEQAFRRLTNVGVTVIGAVVNGVRSSRSYGGYGYSYGSSSVYGDTGGDNGVASPASAASPKDAPSTLDD
jgi:polysaccharide biosynthesis transport protein